ncbi:hypothetical protein HDU96_004479, partial [Phlyctochytrium bullatum]
MPGVASPSITLPAVLSPSNKASEPAKTAKSAVPLAPIIAMEWGCAVTSALLVAPFISIIDKSIFANASGRQPLAQGILSGFTTLVTKPVYFVKQPAFLLIWGVYSGTYIVANSIEAVCNHINVSYFYPKFIGSSIANVSLSVLKDLYFTRAFGKTGGASGEAAAAGAQKAAPAAPQRAVPFRSYSLYTI